ncbi:hypothetical protein VNO78_17844 [Psophocarpus tetragonolobus]|uniref:Uncharacterized protein n=1 Tax=Psophocarpus tetragonolobus TaxID=3891 RepID=A0AAN9XKY1_PSOTE
MIIQFEMVFNPKWVERGVGGGGDVWGDVEEGGELVWLRTRGQDDVAILLHSHSSELIGGAAQLVVIEIIYSYCLTCVCGELKAYGAGLTK